MVSNATKWYESKKKFGGHTKIKSGHKTGYIRTGAYWLYIDSLYKDTLSPHEQTIDVKLRVPFLVAW